jgi:hypothetical protein
MLDMVTKQAQVNEVSSRLMRLFFDQSLGDSLDVQKRAGNQQELARGEQNEALALKIRLAENTFE